MLWIGEARCKACGMKPIRFALAATAALGISVTALAATPDWRDEPDMIGTAYDGHIADDDGQLVIKSWNSEGGIADPEQAFSIGFYTTADRFGISVESLTSRAADGVGSWKIVQFKSVAADRKTTFYTASCGIGPEFSYPEGATEAYVALLPASLNNGETNMTNQVLAASKVDSKTGVITPLPLDGSIYCALSQP